MKRVLALLFIGLVAWAGAQDVIDDDVIDTDAIPDFDPVTTATDADFPDVNFFDDGAFADVTNETLLLSMQVDDTVDWDDWEVTSEYMQNVKPNLPLLGDAGFSLSVADIVAAIQSGGSNPVEKLIIGKVVEAFNRAGVTIRGGSLVYTNNNGPYIQLSTGCSADVHLDAGWGSQAVLRPSTSISVRYGFDGLSLTIATNLHADCSYNMNGHVKARIGKKILGKCIHISKGMGIGVGADMVLDISTQLAIKPTLAWQDNTLVIKFQPTVWVGGQLVRFDPHASASFTIFGIHIRSIEAKIKQAITSEMTRQITPGRVQAELEKLQTAMQAELNRIFAAAAIPIFGMQASHPNYQNVVSAVGNINNRQFH